MPIIILMMLGVIVLAAAVIGIVVVGMEGQGRHRNPEVAHLLAKTAQHLNGEADPPKGLIAFFEEAEGGAEELRGLPERLREHRSARSADSARSAKSARSARSARSAFSGRSARSATSAPDSESIWSKVTERFGSKTGSAHEVPNGEGAGASLRGRLPLDETSSLAKVAEAPTSAWAVWVDESGDADS